MYFVKEFNRDGSFISVTHYCDKKEAFDLKTRIEKYEPEITANISHVFYDKSGTLNEVISF